jgi:hypothetical protein
MTISLLPVSVWRRLTFFKAITKRTSGDNDIELPSFIARALETLTPVSNPWLKFAVIRTIVFCVWSGLNWNRNKWIVIPNGLEKFKVTYNCTFMIIPSWSLGRLCCMVKTKTSSIMNGKGNDHLPSTFIAVPFFVSISYVIPLLIIASN